MDRELYKKYINETLDSLSNDKLKVIYNIVARYWVNSIDKGCAGNE